MPGGWLPPDPPADCDWGRDGQDTPARPSINFSSPDSPPGPSPHVRSNRVRGSGGATPGAGRALCACTGIRFCLYRGACCPPTPPPVTIGARTENHAGTPIHHFSSRDAPLLPLPHLQGNRMQGSGGKNPRRGDGGVCVYGKSSSHLPGGWPPPGPPRRLRLGQRWTTTLT